jgi:hypothetical protein
MDGEGAAVERRRLAPAHRAIGFVRAGVGQLIGTTINRVVADVGLRRVSPSAAR